MLSLNEKKTQAYDWVMRTPNKDQSLLERNLHRTARVTYAIVRDLYHGKPTMHAMSLVFTSILSIVPFLALSFSLLRYFNVQNRFLPMIEHFLLPMGDKGQELHQTIIEFVDNVKVGVLGAVGLLVLLYTVISMVQKIEQAFNQIWYVADTRSISRKLSNYISMIFVGPIVIVAIVSLTSGVFESAIINKLRLVEPVGFMLTLITDLMPSLVLVLAFAFFYKLVPNTRVHAKNALIGAVIAGIAWKLAGSLFTAFVVSSARYEAIYSGFAIAIVALLWLYASWLILLLGSSIAFYVQNDNYITRAIDVKGSPADVEQLALKIMIEVAQAQEQRHAPIKQNTLESMPGVPGLLIRDVVELLLNDKLILDAGSDGEQFVLGRSSDLISVEDILNATRRSKEPDGFEMPESVTAIAEDISQFIAKSYQDKTLRDIA